MPIPVVCSCSAKLKVGDHLQGKQVKCPKCGSLIPVGTPAGGESAAAPTPTRKAVPAGSSLSAGERRLLEAQLEENERLVWADKPDARAAFIRGWFAAVGFAFAAGVIFLILVMMGVSSGFKDGGAVLVLVLLGATGAGFLALGFAFPFMLRWRTGRTFYAFTTRRALAWRCDWVGRLHLISYGPGAVSGVQREAAGADVGNLVFGAERVTRKTKEGREITNRVIRHGFFLIRRPEEVERLLRETLVDPYLDKLYE